MLHIERLEIRLPPDLQHRAQAIAQRVGECLAQLAPAQELRMEHLVLAPVQIPGDASDEEIAHQIVRNVGEQIGVDQ